MDLPRLGGHPRAYLDSRVRNGISVFHRLPEREVSAAMERLRGHLDEGSWDRCYGGLLAMAALDVGLRLVLAARHD